MAVAETGAEDENRGTAQAGDRCSITTPGRHSQQPVRIGLWPTHPVAAGYGSSWPRRYDARRCVVPRLDRLMTAETARTTAGFLLVLSLALLQSSEAVAEPPAGAMSDDTLPKNAVFRLGTDRFRQEGEVKQVKYSKDGKKMASISRESIIIWDACTGRQLRQLRPKSGTEHSQNFSAPVFLA